MYIAVSSSVVTAILTMFIISIGIIFCWRFQRTTNKGNSNHVVFIKVYENIILANSEIMCIY